MKSLRQQLADRLEQQRLRAEEEQKAKDAQAERDYRAKVITAIAASLKDLGFTVNTRKLFTEVSKGKDDAYYIWHHDNLAFTALVTEDDLDDDDVKFLVGVSCRVCSKFVFYPVLTISDFERVVASEGTALHPECQRSEAGQVEPTAMEGGAHD